MNTNFQLWDCLRRVRSLLFHAQSEMLNGWNGDGRGEVIVTAPAEDVVIFAESGTWTPAGGREARFTNVFRWTRLKPGLMRLEHLRFGPDRPVHLFDIAQSKTGLWTSANPHVCRDDCYSAELQICEWGISLAWKVIGPKKDEQIAYEYFLENRISAAVRMHWLAPKEGGRPNAFIGGQYTPTAQFVGEDNQFSVILHLLKTNEPDLKEGSLRLLFPDLSDIQARIGPGVELEIMEGPRMVARCQVVAISKEFAEATPSH